MNKLLFLLLAMAPVDHIIKDFYHHHQYILVAAHRADHGVYAENSLPAIQTAIDKGIDIIEIDVRETKDGVLVLMHDEGIDKKTDGHGKVADMTFSELQALHLKREGVVTKERIPSFRQALEMARGKIMIDIDFKADTKSAMLATCKMVKDMGMEKQVLFFVYDYKDADLVRAIDPDIPVMPRVHNAAETMAVVKQGRYPILHGDDGCYTDSLMQVVRKANMRVWMNALGDYDDLGEQGFDSLLQKKQINVIQTDKPEELLAYLRKKGLHR
ncbi:glycerophosphodiester phosphodiesterase family protein [Chitinophaga sancti]|uniref:Glycerophosphodiester phosphodiesterase family protein n=1 Tax=Chitinophaga sancti TaxID=1004 RepID=A0A1K1RQ95_9BACT|nr:glycerophosphodiester phosphodiesterase family protein [Chitinophaga sancti]WQD62549.1 glycerophosphodiester phosphodiesterase family protein [Chitinophaga sancti]WQG91882.1 glycerophosphodiester phosphodiesterase family protein [Chitinophaga sancti]SFW73997.1 glycerophosphoryl diester phosphodiesterase [Chitinophaga sancti]